MNVQNEQIEKHFEQAIETFLHDKGLLLQL